MKNAIVLFLILLSSAIFAKEKPVHRFALVVGSNFGGAERETLRYAVSDAQSFLRVMSQMGGVTVDKSTLLIEPTAAKLITELARLTEMVNASKKSGARTEAIFYYSGHSDEEGLLLGRNRFSYRDLRAQINGIGSDIKIAILDSCSSGAFTRIKGGSMSSPFMADQSNNMKGFAYMTSSSSDEASQESERIRSSFFTHYLISGLRGAADLTSDGRITLSEAYQYTYRETLKRTQSTIGGAQHPNYNIQMSGTGDVVLTDIRTKKNLLTFSPDINGKIFINEDNSVITEIEKTRGETVALALEDGSYTVILDDNGFLQESKIKLNTSTPVILAAKDFSAMSRENSRSRGGEYEGVEDSGKLPFSFHLFPSTIDENERADDYILHLFGCTVYNVDGLILGFGIANIHGSLNGAAISGVGTIVDSNANDLMLSLGFNSVRGNFVGIQASLISNSNSGNFKGASGSIFLNYTGGDSVGLVSCAIANINSGTSKGFTSSGIMNYCKKDFTGFSICGYTQYSARQILRNAGFGVFKYKYRLFQRISRLHP